MTHHHGSERQGLAHFSGAWLAVMALMAIAAAPVAAPAVTTATPVSTVDSVTVEVVDAITGQPRAQLPIQAKRRNGDVFTWVASATTDAAGKATMRLVGVSSGVRFAIFTTPYNGGSARSADVTAPGAFRFPVGRMPVRVVAGGSEAPLTATKVNLKQKLSDGTLKGIASGTTDAQGMIRFDPIGLGSGGVFVLEALSPWDGSTQRSNEIRDAGGVTFVVGNAPLHVTFIDAVSNAPLATQLVDAYERLADGTLKWSRQRTTSSSGRATFDLAGLGSGRIYVLRAKPYNGLTTDSEDLRAAGEFLFRAGALKVKVVAGGTNKPLVATRVDAYERRPDGTQTYVKGANTDAAGVIRFDLPGLGTGRVFVLRAKSASDGTTKYGNEITQGGETTFVVGNAPLRATVVDAISGAPMAGLSIVAVERLADGSTREIAWRTTDAAGKAVWDLTGLGSGRTYFLSCWPFGTGKANGPTLSAPGDVTFKVGLLQVTVVNGVDGTPLAASDVAALEKLADGKTKWIAGGKTDARGVVRFDLPGVGAGKTYVLETKSPWDGSSKRSDDVVANGQLTFAVGRAPLRVRVTNGLSGDALAGLKVTASRRNGTRLDWVAQRATGADGRVVFDLDGLGAGAVFVLSATPYNGGTVNSDDIREAGAVEFKVGTVELTVLHGGDSTPIAGAKVTALAKTAEGGWTWVKQGTADERGVIRFDLPGLAEGRLYRLKAKSTIDESYKTSPDISAEGVVAFVVGNAPLRVAVVNGVSGAPLPNIKVTAREVLADGTAVWVRERQADAGGVVVFDLDGLGSGRRYNLYARPYNAGSVTSAVIAASGDVYFRVGTVPVTLVDADSEQVLTNRKIIAYQKLDSGERLWVGEGYTDAGGTVHFDLAGLSQTIATQLPPPARAAERVYVFKAHDPFGNGKRYYSGLVEREGPLTMRVDRDVEQPIDFTAPTIAILDPQSGASVDAEGFALLGAASDKVGVASVTATVSDPVKGLALLPVAFAAAQGQWTATVTAAMVTAGETVTVSVTAADLAQNRATTTATYVATADAAPPQVSITAPTNGSNVPRSGFLAGGTATDDIGVRSLVATVDDPLLGRTVTQTLGVGQDGSWSFAVLSGQVSEGRIATLTVTATDAKGNRAAASVSLPVVGVAFLAHHVLNRITFGATPELLAEVQRTGIDAFIAQQLAPATINDGQIAALLTSPPTTKAELQRQQFLRAIYSRRQLLEVLTWFWDNHFNTDVNKHQTVAYEVAENALFRARAFGRFRDLLDATAKSPAMLIYLDNAMSRAGDPNENYARELMELGTLGVDGGYTQTDVEQVARAFTGWTVVNGQFFFDPTNHDGGAKVVLGQTLPAGRGIQDGEQVLDILAAHPSTARFICTKLSRLLVADQPPTSLVDRCAAEYLAQDGSIAALVQILLRSPEFAAPDAFRAKVRTPFEMAVFWPRTLGGTTDASGLHAATSDMGMRIFENPVPTGWSETGDDWINSNLLLQRIRHANRLVRNQIPGTTVDLRAYFTRNFQVTADGIVGFLLQQLFYGEFTPLEYDTAVGVLTDDGTRPFFINQPDAEARLQQMVGTVLGYPGGQYQ